MEDAPRPRGWRKRPARMSAEIIQFPKAQHGPDRSLEALVRVIRALAAESEAHRVEKRRRELRSALVRMSAAMAEVRQGLDQAITILEGHESSEP